MKINYRAFILCTGLFVGNTEAQQKVHTEINVIPVPDSLRSQYDTLIIKHVDEKMIREGWPKLKKGMLKSQVINLLNKPTMLEGSSFDESETWHYGKRIVVFDRIKETLRYWEK